MGLFNKKPEKKVEEEPTIKAAITTDTNVETDRQILNELVLQSINEGVLIVDQKGNIQLVNPAACKFRHCIL